MNTFFKKISLCALATFLSFSSINAEDFKAANAKVDAKLADSKARYNAFLLKMADEKIPLSKELNALQAEVIELRFEAEKALSLRDNKDVDIATLEKDVKVRQDDVDYMANLMQEFLNSLRSRMDASEIQLYDDKLTTALAAIDDTSATQAEKFLAQIEGVKLGINRMNEIIGGSVFEGKAVLPGGAYKEGTFILYGPTAYFVDSTGTNSGLAMQGASGEPTVIALEGSAPTLRATADAQQGTLPLDSTLGKAIAIASTKETIGEHILKGGVWVYPIIFSAVLAMVIALFKFFQLYSIRGLPAGAMSELVKLIRAGKQEEAIRYAHNLPQSPTSEMLVAGAMNCHEDKELLEEILTEKMIEAQPKVERLLAAIATTAATAPLLGLLGTVTGMINTFKLITIFGTGDAKSLSSGISEALITTELGLVVAIPALIFHAILIRKAKGILAGLESTGISFVNGITKKKSAEPEPEPEAEPEAA